MTESGTLYHPVKIGNLEIPGNVFLAPMAGFSDRPYREICALLGAPFAYTEMVSCDGLSFESRKTAMLMESAPSERLFGVQLFTSSPEKARRAVQYTAPFKPDLIDLNCGCPVPKVVKPGAGSALMRTPSTIGAIVSALRKGCADAGLDVPVTVKLRSGWTTDEITYLDAAKAAADGGAEAIALHPRTRSQGYSGKADWRMIATLKSAVDVPVIGSGDLYTPEDIKNMMIETGCDAAMVARGALGNPFIFSRTQDFLTSGDVPEEPSAGTRAETALRHLRVAIEMLGEPRAVKELRKHMCSYTKGLPGSAKIRARVVRACSYDEYEQILSRYIG